MNGAEPEINAGDRVDLSSLSLTEEKDGSYILGTGSTFLAIPPIGADVVRLLDGTRPVYEVEKIIESKSSTAVDVLGFLRTLSSNGLIGVAPEGKNIFDKIPAVLLVF
ncbi:hypothetical protein KIMH_09720 [Bombiscardovia apis]|uniref:Uncharacterized protein n=1 Tax=Bombiscardovia apis TaxID=2932182 RepID=A0ABM8BD85_9BIFI|nr:hypothetical protein [Bombiscardovia apis]BDR54861.1 hypothetical protein KIMH_09720 [Bombiscardovia apis]